MGNSADHWANANRKIVIPMNNIDLSILRLSDTIGQSLNDTFCVCQKIITSYRKELSDSPFVIDLLDDALRSERLKETAHSRILYKILQDSNMQKRFVEYFLPDVGDAFASGFDQLFGGSIGGTMVERS